MTRTWLVTGATGFLGRHLLRDLVARGDRVRALVRSAPVDPLPAGVEAHLGDVGQEATLEPALDGVDGVFHLAGRVLREGPRDQLFALHVDGTANVLRAMQSTGVRRMVLASTSGTVAVSERPVVHGDDAPYATDVVRDWPYYLSKIHAERVATQMARRFGIELVTLRPSLLLGPEDTSFSSTDDVRRFLQGDYPVVPKGGVCFVDVRDCARSFANAMERAPAGSSYLLGAANMTLRDFFGLVANVADVDPPRLEVPDRAWSWGVRALGVAARLGLETVDRVSADMARHYWYADWSRACAEIGHQPRLPAESIEDTVAWLQTYTEPGDPEATGKLVRLPFKLRTPS